MDNEGPTLEERKVSALESIAESLQSLLISIEEYLETPEEE